MGLLFISVRQWKGCLLTGSVAWLAWTVYFLQQWHLQLHNPSRLADAEDPSTLRDVLAPQPRPSSAAATAETIPASDDETNRTRRAAACRGWHPNTETEGGCTDSAAYPSAWLTPEIAPRMFHATAAACCAAFYSGGRCDVVRSGCDAAAATGNDCWGWHVDVAGGDGCTDAADAPAEWRAPGVAAHVFHATAAECCARLFAGRPCPVRDTGCRAGGNATAATMTIMTTHTIRSRMGAPAAAVASSGPGEATAQSQKCRRFTHPSGELPTNTTNKTCAVLFFGLPRSFRMYVLPSIVRNVFRPNLRHGCDYYLHYHSGVTVEETNRETNASGMIQGEDVFLLEDALREVYDEAISHKSKQQHDASSYLLPRRPRISITSTSMEDFWTARNASLHQYETALDTSGLHYLYFPQNAGTWKYPTSLRNLVKQWDSIEAVWKHMVETSAALEETSSSSSKQQPYDRVAMLRSDVVYVTPLDVWKLGGRDLEFDFDNRYITVPDWANYPINDRMVIGPYDAVSVWATRRFALVDHHVKDYPIHGKDGAGWGMHSERFLDHTIFPAMKQMGRDEKGTAMDSGNKSIGDNGQDYYQVYQDPATCFLRARADGAVWMDDCVASYRLGDCSFEPSIVRILEDYHTSEPIDCREEGMRGTLDGDRQRLAKRYRPVLRCRWKHDEGSGGQN